MKGFLPTLFLITINAIIVATRVYYTIVVFILLNKVFVEVPTKNVLSLKR